MRRIQILMAGAACALRRMREPAANHCQLARRLVFLQVEILDDAKALQWKFEP